MQRIFVNVRISNHGRTVFVRALVDTGSDFLVLPRQLKQELEPFEFEESVTVSLADGRSVEMTRCFPAAITIEGFPPIGDEILFGSGHDVLLGHWPLQKSRAMIDEVGHRLVKDPTPYLCVGCRTIWKENTEHMKEYK